MPRHRIVLDTNVLISAIIFGGPPRAVLKLVISGATDCSLSLPILDELKAVLQRPRFGFSTEQTLRVVEELHGICEIVEPLARIDKIQTDPDDNRVLECAIEARARYIVSGDSDLLELGEFEGIHILSPRQYLDRMQ